MSDTDAVHGFEPNLDLYAQLSKPYATKDEADAALDKFAAKVQIARVECGIADIVVVGSVFVEGREDDCYSLGFLRGDLRVSEELAFEMFRGVRRSHRQAQDARMMAMFDALEEARGEEADETT